PLPPRLPREVAAAAGVHAPEATASGPRARRRGHRPLAGEGLPPHKKKPRRRGGATLPPVGAGLLRRPLGRRRWAPRGQPPVMKQKARHREKVSVAAAIWLTPRRDRLGLAYQTLVDGYFTNEEVTDFLQAGLEGLDGPLIVVWGRGGPPSGAPLRALPAKTAPRLDIEPLPPHAPELMPVEFLWRWLKYGRLCNFAPRDAHHLNEAVVRELEAIRDDQELLRAFFHLSNLPMPRALLT